MDCPHEHSWKQGLPALSLSLCFPTETWGSSNQKYQHRLSFLGVWAFDSREVWIWIFLLRHWDGGLESKGFEGQLHIVVSHSMERGVHKLQTALHVQLPEGETAPVRPQLFNKAIFMRESKPNCNSPWHCSADFCIPFKGKMESAYFALEIAGLKLLLENEKFTLAETDQKSPKNKLFISTSNSSSSTTLKCYSRLASCHPSSFYSHLLPHLSFRTESILCMCTSLLFCILFRTLRACWLTLEACSTAA